jgi:uncharacterized protein
MSIFLQAEWRKLAMANYAVDNKLLKPYVPFKTELDYWNHTCYVSLVGFMFLNTRVKGLRIPFHTNFEEVNLRFYVRYKDKGEWKRGVVFITEIVPRLGLTFVANTLYKEHYTTLPMRHSWKIASGDLRVEYRWRKSGWNSFVVNAENSLTRMETGSEEEFIAEHYWGYTRIDDRQTSEYGVEHPRWDIYKTKGYSIDVNFADVYGKNFEFLQRETPTSVVLAEGSEIAVKAGKKL